MDNDTICAVATPVGGAIAVIRVSGGKAIAIADQFFNPAGKRSLADTPAGRFRRGDIVDRSGEMVDDVLVSVFRAPHSYTGEDGVEISCHGSAYIVSRILALLTDGGCRMAEPGEYTQRAFMNGKMDLSQAEAVADLIAASSRAAHRVATRQLRGQFSSQLAELRAQLLHLTTLMELELDFSDHEDLEFADRTQLFTLTQTIATRIATLMRSYDTGRALRQGVPVAIVGKTNVGKSTLLNKLVGDERAIVSDVHGTTRDTIEDCAEIGGVTFRFIDTAGIRDTTDQVERLGIERTYKKIAEAAIILWMTDTAPTGEETREVIRLAEGKRLIAVRNKTDLATAAEAPYPTPLPTDILQIGISARQGTHIDELRQAIYSAAGLATLQEGDVVVTSARHYAALAAAAADIARVADGLTTHTPTDLLAEDLRLCATHLGEITGDTIATPEVLKSIFQGYCIGK